MNENNELSLPNYIVHSLMAAWGMIKINPKAMDYFDLSSDGFWKSFWAIAVMLPVFILSIIYGAQAEGRLPVATEVIFFFITLPLTAVVMYYFTRFMKIGTNYPSMIIASNWITAINYNILVVAGLIMNLLAPENKMSLIVIYLLSFYFGVYVVWFMYKTSLKISGFLAAGVLLFDILFSWSARVMLLKVLDPEIYNKMFAAANNLPS